MVFSCLETHPQKYIYKSEVNEFAMYVIVGRVSYKGNPRQGTDQVVDVHGRGTKDHFFQSENSFLRRNSVCQLFWG